MRHVARELHAIGSSVEVWAVDRGTGPVDREIDGIPVRYMPTPLPTGSPGGVARFVAAFPGAWRRWAAAKRSFRPDIIHVHCFGPNGVYALGMHYRFRVPLVVTSHGETVADEFAAFHRSLVLRAALRRSLAASAAVTGPSDFVIAELRNNFGLVGGEVIPNGVDLALAGTRGASGRPYLLGVGRLGKVKGFDLLIEAFAGAHLDGDPDLIIVGEGPDEGRLRRLIAERNLDDRVRLVGRREPAAVADAMAGAVALVVPSRVEPFGIVALEAWRSGAPLVMTARGGGPGFVRDGVDGILVDPVDIPALRDALTRIVTDHDLRARLSAAGRRRVRSFTWRRVAEAYQSLYDSILAVRGPGTERPETAQ